MADKNPTASFARLFEELYDPLFEKKDTHLHQSLNSRWKKSVEEAEESFEKIPDLDEVIAERRRTGKPLTKEQADAVDSKIEMLSAQCDRIRGKLSGVVDQIDKELRDESCTFTFEVGKRPRLKRAVKAVFGSKRSVITYDMYKYALDRRRELEQAESDSVFESDDEDAATESDPVDTSYGV